MITFLPINSHPKPSEVLVIGGGDGGVLRELDRHPLVKNVTLCEIDEDVINVSKKYLPNMAKGFTSKKAKIIIEDAFEHIQRNTHKYDVIICDLTDPAGSPSEKLYTSESISLMHNSLKQDGILCLQSECFWMSLNLISNLMKYCTSKFSVCRYASAYTPFYLFGQLGFLLCSKSKVYSSNFIGQDIEFDKPSFIMDPSIYGLKYYSAAIHQASFILPNFVNEVSSFFLFNRLFTIHLQWLTRSYTPI
ncbi:hypothetical protein HZS_2243 [Henneguya salminicola]|nr:hypothetical protein HZS_2243 [Henneguya salminicola]